MLHNMTPKTQQSNTETSGLQRICAWCGRVKINEIWEVRPPLEDRPLTHGLCPECYNKMMSKLEREK